MAIFRGTGGSAETSNQAYINEVAEDSALAEQKAQEAAASAASAATSATNAANSASSASTSANTASQAITTVQASETAAASSASSAASSAASASASATTATTKASEASTSEANAQASATNAASSATNAANSASAASASATNAANSASAAATSASASSVSADEAAASAASIVGSVAEATTKASEAAASAANAESAWDSFDDRYLGAKATEPTVDNDGNALVVGAMYFDSTNNATMLYNGTEWQAASSSIDGIKTDFVYTATAGQTVFSGNDDNTNELVIDKVGLANVYLNGVRLSDSDYTASAPSNSITLSTGASVGDIVEVEVFGHFAGQSGADVAITGGSITGVTLNATGFTSTGIDDNATSTAITIDANENVGIGTASPDNALEVGGEGILRIRPTTNNSQGALYFNDTDGANSYRSDVGIINNGGLYFKTTGSLNTAPTERARIDSSGNLLVGGTSVAYGAGERVSVVSPDNHGIGIKYSGSAKHGLGIWKTDGDGNLIKFASGASGTAVGSIGSISGVISNFVFDPRAHVAGTGIGLSASKATGDVPYLSPRNGSGIRLDGAVVLGNFDNRFKDLYLSGGVLGDTLTFKNNNGTEKARIDSSGNLMVGTTSILGPLSNGGTGITLRPEGNAYLGSTATPLFLNRSGSDGEILNLRKDGSTVGSITAHGTRIGFGGGSTGLRIHDDITSVLPYNPSTGGNQFGTVSLGHSATKFKDLYLSGGVITSSDYRLKDDVQPMQSCADIVKQMNLVNFAWKDSGEREDGFIAHELQALVPVAVRGEKDAVGEDGNEQYQGVDPLKLIPVLTKALQEALERIETLENK
jgi:hypothetical protein